MIKAFFAVLLASQISFADAQTWDCEAVLKNEDGCQIPGVSMKVRFFDQKIALTELKLTDVFLNESTLPDTVLRLEASESPEIIGVSSSGTVSPRITLFRGLLPLGATEMPVALNVDGVLHSSFCTKTL